MKSTKLLFLFFIVLVFNTEEGKSQNLHFSDARSIGLAGISTTVTNSAYTFLSNPANLALIRRPIFSININNLFEYDQAALSDHFPSIGALGLVIGRLNSMNSVDYAGIGWGKASFSGLNVGMSSIVYHKEEELAVEWQLGISYFPSRINGGNSHLLSALRKFDFAATLQNSSLSPKKFGPPLQFNFGMRYYAIPEFAVIYLENQFRKNSNNFISAFELHTSQFMTLRSGISNFDKNRLLFGFGVHLNNFNLDFVYQRYLGKFQFSTTILFGESPLIRASKYYDAGIEYLKRKKMRTALTNFRYASFYNPENMSYKKMYSYLQKLERELFEQEKQLLNNARGFESRGEILAGLLRYIDIAEKFPENEQVRRKIEFLKPAVRPQMAEVKTTALDLFNNGNFTDAGKIFDRISKIDLNDTMIIKYQKMIEDSIDQKFMNYLHRGLGYLIDENLYSAKTNLELAFNLKPNNPEIKTYLNDVQSQIKLNRSKIDSLWNLALKHESADDFVKAIENYNLILKFDDRDEKTINRIAAIKLKVNSQIGSLLSQAQFAFDASDFQKAETICRNILRIYPDENKAKAILRKSKRSRIKLAEELFQKGEKYLEEQKFAQAIVSYLRAISLDKTKERYQNSFRLAESELDAQIKFRNATEHINKNNMLEAEKVII